MWQYRSQNRFRIQALRRTGKAWLFFISLICISNTPDAGELYRGLYVGGFEHSDFMPCGTQERWWLQGEAYAQIQAAVTEKRRTPGNTDWTLSSPVYVELRGSLSKPGRYGHMGAYSRQLNAQKLIYLSFTNQCNNK